MTMKHVFGIGVALLSLAAGLGSSASVYAGDTLSASEIERARTAWAEAIRLAKHRNKGNVCEEGAYQSSIIEQLAISTGISAYLRTQAISNVHLKKALAGNLMYFDLTGRMGSSADIEKAISQAYFESMDGGVLGSSTKIQLKPGNVVIMKTVEMTEDGEVLVRSTLGTYELQQSEGSVRLSLQVGSEAMEFLLEKDAESQTYLLRKISGAEVDFSNEPDECSA